MKQNGTIKKDVVVPSANTVLTTMADPNNTVLFFNKNDNEDYKCKYTHNTVLYCPVDQSNR